MKTEITIPTNLSEIPLVNYQKFIKVVEKSNDQEFIAQKTIEIFCGLKMHDVLKIKYSDVQDLTNHFAKLFEEKPKFKPTFSIGEIEFGFIPNLEEMSFGEYVDLESTIGNIQDFHRAMAVMYRPIKTRMKDKYEIIEYKGTSEFSDLMKYAPLDVVISASVFFWNLGNDLIQTSLTFLETEMKTNPKIKTTLAKELNLTNNGDGIIQSMHSLKETLHDLMQSQSWALGSVLHGLHTSDKKTKLNNANLIEN